MEIDLEALDRLVDASRDKRGCFARIDNKHCNALKTKKCSHCKFYKDRKEIVNNPFYAWSYKNSRKHELDMKKYKIRKGDVIYD